MFSVHKKHTYFTNERVWCTTQLAKLSFNHSNRSYSQLTFFNIFYKLILHPSVVFTADAFQWQNRVYPGGFWTKSGTFFSRRGAFTHVCKTPPKRVLAPEPTTPCVRAAPQTVFSVFDPSIQRQCRRPKSALHEQPDFVQERTGYTLPCASIL